MKYSRLLARKQSPPLADSSHTKSVNLAQIYERGATFSLSKKEINVAAIPRKLAEGKKSAGSVVTRSVAVKLSSFKFRASHWRPCRVTRFIHKRTEGFNCQVIRRFDGLTRIRGGKQRKPRHDFCNRCQSQCFTRLSYACR